MSTMVTGSVSLGEYHPSATVRSAQSRLNGGSMTKLTHGSSRATPSSANPTANKTARTRARIVLPRAAVRQTKVTCLQ